MDMTIISELIPLAQTIIRVIGLVIIADKLGKKKLFKFLKAVVKRS